MARTGGEGAALGAAPEEADAAAAEAEEAARSPEELAAESWALVSAEERSARLAAQTRLRQMLALPEGRTKLLLHPRTLPTARYAGKCLCPWENLGLPCPTTEREHYFRHCHRVCAYCYVNGHALDECPLAKRDGLAVGAALLQGAPAAGSGAPATPALTPVRGAPSPRVTSPRSAWPTASPRTPGPASRASSIHI